MWFAGCRLKSCESNKLNPFCSYFLFLSHCKSSNEKEMVSKLLLPPILFWDIDPDKLDYDAKARYVIGRVVMYGSLADWKATLAYYGPERIRDEMLLERYLDKKTLNYLSFYFDVPKTEFRCYTLQQSTPKHWDY
jgi:hypothetical protein